MIILKPEDILAHKSPKQGEFVAFAIFDPMRQRYRLQSGYISSEYTSDTWVVSGEIRMKSMMLFVIKPGAHSRLRKYTDSLVN